MLHTIFIKCKVDVIYFIFIFISSSVPRFSVKKSVNQLIKIKGLIKHGGKTQPTRTGQAANPQPPGLRCHSFKLQRCYPLDHSKIHRPKKLKT